MKKITLEIDGMYCSMCEAHMNDVIRNCYPKAKKVSSSYKKGITSFLLEEQVDRNKINKAVEEIGYQIKGIQEEGVQHKAFSFFG
ncbi:MAG: ATPase P [Solobacterium sp.]|nr:ATPase P [Solobacterium sp.]